MPAATRGTGAARGAEICGLAQTLPSSSIGAKGARLSKRQYCHMLEQRVGRKMASVGCSIRHEPTCLIGPGETDHRDPRNWTRTRLYLISDKIVSAVTLRSACRAVCHLRARPYFAPYLPRWTFEGESSHLFHARVQRLPSHPGSSSSITLKHRAISMNCLMFPNRLNASPQCFSSTVRAPHG